MNRLFATAAIIVMVMSGILISEVSYARGKEKLYEVTITNITRGQIISPLIVISHNKDFQLFSLGNPESPASPGLALLAEEGMPTMLATELNELDSVLQYTTTDGGLMPGTSITVVIATKKGFRQLSAAGMLVSTNDTFFAVRGVEVRSKGNMTVDARAYDAGTEINSELCEFIPGPSSPCDTPELGHDPSTPEGYVYISSGIHGMGDLDPAQFDWRNPVVTIMVKKVK